MKITHVIPYMHPAAGGPPVVVDRLSRELASRGHELRVLTTDLFGRSNGSWPTNEPRPYGLDVFPTTGGNGYGFSTRFWKEIRRSVASCDLVHIHTLWTFASLAAARACVAARVPFLVMPHGMLDPYSVRRGWFKKQCYGRLLEWPLLRRARGFCYTHTEEERLAAMTCRHLPRGYIVELGTESPPDAAGSVLRDEFLNRYPQLRGRSLVLFLGRIDPKKGLDLLIPAFDLVRRRQPNAHLLIVGPGNAAYIDGLRAEISSRNLAEQVTFTGILQGRDKWGAIAASELFVLPSYQENFALTVVEAVRGGLPVVLSRRVNLWKDVVDAGAGRDCELTIESVGETISDTLTDTAWQRSAVKAGERLLAKRFDWATSAVKLESIYQEAARS